MITEEFGILCNAFPKDLTTPSRHFIIKPCREEHSPRTCPIDSIAILHLRRRIDSLRVWWIFFRLGQPERIWTRVLNCLFVNFALGCLPQWGTLLTKIFWCDPLRFTMLRIFLILPFPGLFSNIFSSLRFCIQAHSFSSQNWLPFLLQYHLNCSVVQRSWCHLLQQPSMD